MSTGSDLEVVEAMIAAGRPFEEIEDYIEERPLSYDSKTALWMFAYFYALTDDERRVVTARMVAVCG